MHHRIRSVGIVAVATALVGTIALPAVAIQPTGQEADATVLELAAQTRQQVEAQESAAVQQIALEGLSATSPEELAQIQAEAAAAAAAAEQARQEELAAAQAATESASGATTTAAAAAPAQANAQVAASAASGSIVGIAQSQLGVPYVWGGASPATGFDCSGFTQWVYGQVGIYLPHSDRGQLGYGTPVSAANVQAGDLLIWGGHTAIYAGNGQIIHAATAGKPVKYSSYSAMVGAMGTPEVRRF